VTAPRPSEFELIARYFAPMAGEGALGLLDDAGIITPPPGHDLVITTDMLVAGVHFFPDDPPALIARKALRVNLSDLAAKGAKPLGFLLGLGLPRDWNSGWLEAFANGLGEDCRHYACPLLGGDTVKASGGLTLSVTAFGSVPAGTMVRRTAAGAGDALYVTGTIGDSAVGLQARLVPDAPWFKGLAPADQAWLLDAYLLPEPRVALAGLIAAYASAAMDISDGFAGDLVKMMSPSALGVTIALDAVPLAAAARAAIELAPSLLKSALTGGDDYEVLLTVPAAREAAFVAEAKRLGHTVYRLATVSGASAAPVTIVDAQGNALDLGTGSFVHF
jgi:thiamine-monophosphate kinase